MSDLRTLHRSLVAKAVVSTPPFDAVVGNAHRIRVRQAMSGAVVVLALAMLAAASLPRPEDSVHNRPPVDSPTETTVAGPASEDSDAGPASLSAGSPSSSPPTTSQESSGAAAPATWGSCPERPSREPIQLLVGAHIDGPAKTYAEDAPSAIKVVFDEVNRTGGICGRPISAQVRHRPFRGVPPGTAGFIGLVPAPLDPDFDALIADGTFDRWQLPTGGGDGFSRLHYSSPWLAPVGTPISGLTRIAVDEAYRAGARTFALV